MKHLGPTEYHQPQISEPTSGAFYIKSEDMTGVSLITSKSQKIWLA